MFGDKEFGKNAGYPTPTTTPTDLTCLTLKLPANAEWWAVYSGLLLTLTYEEAWQQFEGGITREQAAHCAMEIYEAAIEAAATLNNCGGCALPSGAAVVGLDELGSWRMLDNGDWGPPSGDYTLPDYTPRTQPTADERKCLAASNAANVLKELYEQVTDIAQLGLPIAEAIVLFAAGVGAAIAGPLGLLAGAFMEIALIAIKEFFSAALYITEDVWDESFDESLVCTLYNNASDDAGVVTFNYDQVYTDIQLQTFWLDPTVASQRLCGQLMYLLQVIGAEGLNLAGETTAISSADCTSCGCEDVDWDKVWDFTTGSYGFVAAVGTYVPGVGFPNNGADASWRTYASGTFGSACANEIQGIEVIFSGSQNQSRIVQAFISPDGTPVGYVDGSNTPGVSPFGGPVTLVVSGGQAIGLLWLLDDPTPSGCVVTGFHIWGHGTEPDWAY